MRCIDTNEYVAVAAARKSTADEEQAGRHRQAQAGTGRHRQ